MAGGLFEREEMYWAYGCISGRYPDYLPPLALLICILGHEIQFRLVTLLGLSFNLLVAEAEILVFSW